MRRQRRGWEDREENERIGEKKRSWKNREKISRRGWEDQVREWEEYEKDKQKS